jgi:hypothetical protein
MVEGKIIQEKSVATVFCLAYICGIGEVQNINGKIRNIFFYKTIIAKIYLIQVYAP